MHVDEIERGVVRTLSGRIAHDDELGIHYSDSRHCAAQLALPASPAACMSDGRISVGAIVTLMDTVCGIGAMASMGFDEAVATIDLRLDYLRPPRRAAPVMAQSWMVARRGEPEAGSLLMHAKLYEVGCSEEIALCSGRFLRRPMPDDTSSGTFSSGDRQATSSTGSYRDLMAFCDGAGGETVLPYRPGLLGNGSLPSLHGGAIASVLQEGALRHLARTRGATLSLVTAHFLFQRFGRPIDVTARPVSGRTGRRAAFIGMTAHQCADPARPIATGQFTFAPA